MEPVTLAALTAAALTEGVKFLYGQAGEILRRRRERKDAAEAERAAVAVPTPEVVEGTLEPITVDVDAADKLADELRSLRATLADYVEGIEPVETSDERLVSTTAALRDAIESIIGQRITFKGEAREPTGTPVVTGTLTAKEIHGRASGIAMDRADPGHYHGRLDTDTVGETGDAAGVRIGKNTRG
jgi:hypothetical protein